MQARCRRRGNVVDRRGQIRSANPVVAVINTTCNYGQVVAALNATDQGCRTVNASPVAPVLLRNFLAAATSARCHGRAIASCAAGGGTVHRPCRSRLPAPAAAVSPCGPHPATGIIAGAEARCPAPQRAAHPRPGIVAGAEARLPRSLNGPSATRHRRRGRPGRAYVVMRWRAGRPMPSGDRDQLSSGLGRSVFGTGHPRDGLLHQRPCRPGRWRHLRASPGCMHSNSQLV